MPYSLNLGEWGSVFAVPSSLVDKHLKLASEAQLKVLLYLLKNAALEQSDAEIGKALHIDPDEVQNAVTFWIDRGLLTKRGEALSPADAAAQAEHKPKQNTPDEQNTDSEPKSEPKPTAPSRAQRPDPTYVAKRLGEDKNLAGLMEEAQSALSKPLSPGDAAVLTMLYDSFGLPCEVIAMLICYEVSDGRANMRAIEKRGISWSDKGIYTVSAAEQEIERLSQSRDAWRRVSTLFGIRQVGHPTASQLEHASRWIYDWGFSDEMLSEAYERCVDTKGAYNIRYINAILSRWQEKGIKSQDALREEESRTRPQKKKQGSLFSSQDASYDLSDYKNKSLFDD